MGKMRNEENNFEGELTEEQESQLLSGELI